MQKGLISSFSASLKLAALIIIIFNIGVLAQPLPPINIRLLSYENHNRIVWEHNPLETPGYVDHYQICRGTVSGSTTPVDTVSAGTTAYNDSSAGYSFSQEFFYTVRAVGTDMLVSAHSEELKRFLPRAGLTSIPMQTNTVTGQQYISFDHYPGDCTDVYFRIRSSPFGGSNYNLADFQNRPVVFYTRNYEIPPGGPYWAEVRLYRPDWWGNPAERREYVYCYSEPFYINAEVPYEDNASSTYFNSSQNRVMSVPLPSGGVEAFSFSNSGGGFWRMRQPVEVTPYTEFLRDPTSYLSKFNAPCRVTVNISPGQMNTGQAAAQVRVADERGNELPSVVVAETNAGPWVTSFTVHFIANQDYNDTQIYWVYWANPSATQNLYDFKANISKPAQFEYSPWFSRKILRGANESASLIDTDRLITNPPSPADDEMAAFTLPFVFPYYDIATNTLYASSNGYLTVNPYSQSNNTWADFTGNNSYGFIAPFWCNLMINDTVPGDAGVYGDLVDGNLRRQRFQITWRANRFNAPNEIYIFQANLYRLGDIALRYETLNVNGLTTLPSVSGDNPINVAPHHTAGVSANDGSNYVQITDDGSDEEVCPLKDGTGRNVIHFLQSCHSWTVDTAYTDPTNTCAMTGATSVGHYNSRFFDGRSSAPTWSNLYVDTSGTGLIDFYVRSSTDFNFPAWDASHLIASDLAAGNHSFALSIPDERFVQYRAVFKKTNAADNPRLDRVEFDVGYITIDETTSEINNQWVSQGQTFLASMTFSNFFSNPVSVQVASLTFTNGTQSFTQLTPMPFNVANGASATIGFRVTVATDSSYLNNWIYIDGYLEAGDGVTTLSSSEAISRSQFRVREKPQLVISKIDAPFDKVNKGQGGIPVSVEISNPTAYIPVVFGGASLTFSLGNHSWVSAQTFAPGDQGLFAQYYNTDTSNPPNFPSSPDATRIDPNINFSNVDWANGVSPYPPEIGSDYYGVKWSGMITPDFSERYTFVFSKRGGGRLWVNGKLLIDNWAWQTNALSGEIDLVAGVPVEIVAEYYKLTNWGRAQINWSSASLADEPIPQSKLKPAYRSIIHPNSSINADFIVAVLPDSVSGLAYIDANSEGYNAWATDMKLQDNSAATIDSWLIQTPADLAIGIIDAPELVYRGQANIPIEVEVINLGEADALVSSVPISLSLGSYSAIIAGETMPVTINGDSSRFVKVLVSIEENTATGTADIDAEVIGSDANVGTPLYGSDALTPDQWTILAEKILTYSDASHLLPLAAFVLPDSGTNFIYVKAENLAPLREYAIRWFDTSNNEIVSARTIGFADASGNLYSELEYDNSFAYGIYKVKITNPVGTFSPAETSFSIVTSSNLSGNISLPTKVSVGQNFQAQMSLNNSGGAEAAGMVTSDLVKSGIGSANLLSGPTPGSLDLPGYSQATFTWNFTAVASGSLQLSGHSQGFETGSNEPVSVTVGRHGLLLEETFEEYPINQTINGEDSGQGWSGPWSGTVGIQQTILVNNAMNYTSGMGQQLFGGFKAARITGDNNEVLVRNLATPIDLPELYISMLVRFNGVQGNNKFLGLWFENYGYGTAPNIGFKMNHGDGSGPEDFFIRTQFNEAYSTDLVPGQTYLIVGRLSKFAGTGTYDQFELWVNPADLSSPPAPDAFTSGVSAVSSFSKIGFRTLNMAGGDSFDVAALRIGRSWDSVTAQPLLSNICIIQTPAVVTIDGLTATPSIVFYEQKGIDVLATLQNHGEADARIDFTDLIQTPGFGFDILASPSVLPAILPGNSIATYVFKVDINNGAPIGLATMTTQIRFEDVNNPTPTMVTDQDYCWMIVDTRIICSRDAGFTSEQYIFNAGQTVFARGSGLPNNLDVRMRFYDTSVNNPPLVGDVGVGIQTPLNTGTDGMVTHFHDIPVDTDKIQQWMIVIDDGNDTTLGNILGIQYFEIVKPAQLQLELNIGSNTCYVGDLVNVDFSVTNVSTWPTNLRHLLQNYSNSMLYPTQNSVGYMTLQTPWPARGWHYDIGPGQTHLYRFIFKAESDSGISGASTSIELVNNLLRVTDMNSNTNEYSNPIISSNSITIFKKSFRIVPDGFSIPTAPGLIGDYYPSYSANPPPMPAGETSFSRVDPMVNFDWGGSGPYPGELGSDYYAIRWSGFLTPHKNGNHTFYTRTDDGNRLWVDGNLLVDRWVAQGATERSGILNVTAGVPIPIVMEYFERGGDSVAELRWDGPSIPKDFIPTANLSHEIDFSVTWDFGSVEPGSESVLLENTLENTGNRDLNKISILRPALRKSLTEFIPGSNLIISPPLPLSALISGNTALNARMTVPYFQPAGTYVATMTVYEDHRNTGTFETDYPHRLVMARIQVPSVARAIVTNSIDFGVVAPGTTSAIKKIEYTGTGNTDLTDLRFLSPLSEITITPDTIGYMAFNGSGSVDIFIDVPIGQTSGLYSAQGSIYDNIVGGASEAFNITWEVGTFSLALTPPLVDFGVGTPTRLLPVQQLNIENTGELPLKRLQEITTEFINLDQAYSLATDNVSLESPILVNVLNTEQGSASIYIPGGIATGTYIGTFTWFEDQNENLLLDSYEAKDKCLASFSVLEFYKLYTLKPTEDFGGVKPDTNKAISVGLRNAGSMPIKRLGFLINDLSDGFDSYAAANITLPAPVEDIVPGEVRYFTLSAYVPLFHKHGIFIGQATVFGDLNLNGTLDVGEPSHQFNLRIEIGDQKVKINSPASLLISGNAAATTSPESVTVKNTGSLSLTRVKTRINDLVPLAPGTTIASSTVVFLPSASIGALVPTQSQTFSIRINIPFAQPPGTYTSTLYAWEDANNDNLIQPEEASSSIPVTLEVILVKEMQTTPGSLNLGILARGDVATASILAQNIGNVQLSDARWHFNNLTSPPAGLISATSISITPDPVGVMATPPVGLPTNEVSTFTVTIPTSASDGLYNGNMIFYEDDFNPLLNAYDAGNEVFFPLPVTLQVVSPVVSVIPDPVTYPAAQPTGYTASVTFTISNSGLINFKNLRYSVSNMFNGAHMIPAANIKFLPTSFSALTVGSSEIIESSVFLSPTSLAPGTFNGTLTIWDDRNGNSTIDTWETPVPVGLSLTVNNYYSLNVIPTLVDMGKVARNQTSAVFEVGFQNQGNVQLSGLTWDKTDLSNGFDIIANGLINFTFLQAEPVLPGQFASAALTIGPIDNAQPLDVYGNNPQTLRVGAFTSDSFLLRCEVIPGGPQGLASGSIYQEVATLSFPVAPAAPDNFILSAYVCPATGSARIGFLQTDEAGINTGYFGIEVDNSGGLTLFPPAAKGGITETYKHFHADYGLSFDWYRVFIHFPYAYDETVASKTYILLQNTSPESHAVWFDGVQIEKLDPDYELPTSWSNRSKIFSPSIIKDMIDEQRYFQW